RQSAKDRNPFVANLQNPTDLPLFSYSLWEGGRLPGRDSRSDVIGGRIRRCFRRPQPTPCQPGRQIQDDKPKEERRSPANQEQEQSGDARYCLCEPGECRAVELPSEGLLWHRDLFPHGKEDVREDHAVL